MGSLLCECPLPIHLLGIGDSCGIDSGVVNGIDTFDRLVCVCCVCMMNIVCVWHCVCLALCVFDIVCVTVCVFDCG